MGVEWTVSAWVRVGNTYTYVTQIETNSAWRALRAALKAKREGSGCVKVEWR